MCYVCFDIEIPPFFFFSNKTKTKKNKCPSYTRYIQNVKHFRRWQSPLHVSLHIHTVLRSVSAQKATEQRQSSTGRFSAYFFVYSSAFLQNFLLSLVYSSARSALNGCSGSGSSTKAASAWMTVQRGNKINRTIKLKGQWTSITSIFF